MKVKSLESVCRPEQDIVEILEKLLNAAKGGHITALAVAALGTHRCVNFARSKSKRASAVKMVGAIELLKGDWIRDYIET